jgi:hypothetical protein
MADESGPPLRNRSFTIKDFLKEAASGLLHELEFPARFLGISI